METKILDTIENGVLITNKQLEIIFWNKWLSIHTGIPKEIAEGSDLEKLFSGIPFDILKRKIDIALKLKSPTFIQSTIEKYVIPIELKKITKSVFRHMRQDGVISPVNEESVSVVLYDASPLLEARSIIDEQIQLLEQQAKVDSLTQCFNKNMFNQLLSKEIKLANRHAHFFSLIIFDIDNFKIINDTHGHIAGDSVLKELAEVSNNELRISDTLARWGGEEFCILLPETELKGAVTVAEKVRKAIELHDFGTAGPQSCSFGVAQYTPGIQENEMIVNADRALYHAKHHGKNQVAVFQNKTISTWCPKK